MSQPKAADVKIRPSRPEDLQPVLQFLKPFIQAGRILPRTEQEAKELLRNGFVAERQGRIVGFVALEVYSKKLAEIRSLAVAPEVQGTGVGRRLVQACVERAKQLRVREVMAITSQDGFFRSCGFDYALPGERKALFLETSSDSSDQP